MKTKIRKWGNSHAVRIPNTFIKEAGLRLDDSVDVSLNDGKIIVTPIKVKKYKLKELLSGITKKNIHAEVDAGKPVGNEIW